LDGDTQTSLQNSFNIWIGVIIFFKIFWLVAIWVNFSWAEVSYDDKNGSIETVSLEECLKIAKENSKELQNSIDKFNIAKLKVENVKADLWPRVSVAADYELLHNKQTDDFKSDKVEQYLVLSQDIYNTSSQNFSKKWMSMIDLVTAELDIEKTKRNIYLSVAKKYYDLLLAQQILKLESSMLEQSRRDLKKAKSKYKDGLVSEFEVIQSKTNLVRSDLNYRAKQNALKYANMSLATTLGLPIDTNMNAVDVGFPKQYSIDWDQCQKLAIKYNTELAIQRKALEQIPKYQKLAKRIAWPTLTMKAFVGEGSPEAEDKINDDMGVIFTISKTIFDSGVTRRKIKITETKIKNEDSLIRMY
jgi:outer membrane protein TolC